MCCVQQERERGRKKDDSRKQQRAALHQLTLCGKGSLPCLASTVYEEPSSWLEPRISKLLQATVHDHWWELLI